MMVVSGGIGKRKIMVSIFVIMDFKDYLGVVW